MCSNADLLCVCSFVVAVAVVLIELGCHFSHIASYIGDCMQSSGQNLLGGWMDSGGVTGGLFSGFLDKCVIGRY